MEVITELPDWVGVRDSNLGADSPVLACTTAQWQTTLTGARVGKLPPGTAGVALCCRCPSRRGWIVTVVEFSEPSNPRIVYLDRMTNSEYLEGLRDVAAYRHAHDQLRASALSPSESRQMISSLLRELIR
ncbi:MAG: hypothetical protein QOE58_2582 [Actinomycetota bacterium]|nr:hypothetical protein [Actinomycetota bacterium]